MREFAIAYISAAFVMAGLDAIWLGIAAKGLYRNALGPLLAENPNMAAAVAFYIIYLVGVVFFAIRPGLENAEWRTSLVNGALFGFFAYATYDLTNLATLKGWPLGICAIDIAWGTFLTAVVAGVGSACAIGLRQ